MDLVLVFLIVLSVIVLVLIILSGFLLLYSYNINKKFDLMLEKGKIKDLKDIFLKQIKKGEEQEEMTKEAFNRIKNLESISEKTIQKIDIVRFNPFSDLGGNQSFIIALLDKKNNGFLISSLFVNEGSRVYAKTIRDGKSDYNLSKEELEAIERAVNFK
ncbi:MAG: DUF4446 family protein [Patescibacteria group bacterium]